ncbi:cytochrome oxidase assembly [Kyrpidia tusciae DSM 2912]|uniref:Cytochrome oxidase assembly n=1 Tax=Kyrpidia tusciae (strain DSM 2912 / NBRC 15312 / T2) TaxID=562970 RepID=D5WSZ8_KYRT2|nr:cytochrome oxidase assembly [Kyrpidia tusciae DSM 2912]
MNSTEGDGTVGYRLPLVTAVTIYISMVMGALVVGLNAGFVCPDWPLCNGQLIPPLDGLVLVEYTHRLVAAAVSLLVLAVAVVGFRNRKRLDRLSKWLLGITVASISVQVIAGALIVVLVLPGAFTTIDVGNSMILFATMVALTVHLRRSAGSGTAVAPREMNTKDRRLMRAAWITAGAAFGEVLLGGYFRHSGAGEALFGKGTYLASHQQFMIPSKIFSTTVFALHILFSFVVAALAVWLLTEAVRSARGVKTVVLYLSLLVAEMAAGAVAYLLELNVASVTVHWSGAALVVGLGSYLVTGLWHDLHGQQINPGHETVVAKGSSDGLTAGGRM